MVCFLNRSVNVADPVPAAFWQVPEPAGQIKNRHLLQNQQ